MMLRRLIPFLIATAPFAAWGQYVPTAANDIKRAEFAFAADALQRGTKAAFLTAMHDSAIVFRNAVPTLARPLWNARPDPKPGAPTLRWAPTRVIAAFDGSLGFSTGPWLLTDSTGKPLANGQFFTIWARQADGTYRWLLDNGVSYPLTAPPVVLPTPEQTTALFSGTISWSASHLERLDAALSRQIARKGAEAAFAPLLMPETLLLRDGQPPLAERDAVRRQLATEGKRQFTQHGGRCAAMGDLAYTYGTYRTLGNAAAQGSYVHLWERYGDWRLLAEIINAAEPARP